MEKNFIVTTGLIDTWEFDENNYLLGKWCDFSEENHFDKKKFRREILEKVKVIQNKHHWHDNKKKIKDYEYLN